MTRQYFLHIAVAIAVAIIALVIIRLHSANGVAPASEVATTVRR